MTIRIRCLFFGMTIALVGSIAVARPQVSDVRLVQQQNSRTVHIYYRLTGGNAYVTMGIETNAATSPEWSGVRIPDQHVVRVSGDVSCLVMADENNDKQIVWNAGTDWPDQKLDEVRAVIEVWTRDKLPQYLVLNLGQAYDENASFPLHVYNSAEALPDGGLTNDIYRTERLVLRRIENGCFYMGSPMDEVGKSGSEGADGAGKEQLHLVTLTHDYYIGVFAMTQGQWQRVMNTNPSANTGLSAPPVDVRPVENCSYNVIRGGSWPLADDAPDIDTFVERLRMKSDGLLFDLPTEAQWEYACRAGTQTALNNGLNLTTTTMLCTNRDPIAWDAFNSGTAPKQNTRHHRVGEKLSNAWGLYDMLGNVAEIVRDRIMITLGYGWMTDPVGNLSGTSYVRKGGSFTTQADPRSASRYGLYKTSKMHNTGFRITMLTEGKPAVVPLAP